MKMALTKEQMHDHPDYALIRSEWSTSKQKLINYYKKTELSKYNGKPVIGWKKCYICVNPSSEDKFVGPSFVDHAIVKLEIPADAARRSPRNYKCRASKAKVLEFFHIEETPQLHIPKLSKKPFELKDREFVCSMHDRDFVYEIGKIIKPTNRFSNKPNECAAGIHFFLDIKQALNYC